MIKLSKLHITQVHQNVKTRLKRCQISTQQKATDKHTAGLNAELEL